jgi:hypothetical protein
MFSGLCGGTECAVIIAAVDQQPGVANFTGLVAADSWTQNFMHHEKQKSQDTPEVARTRTSRHSAVSRQTQVECQEKISTL